MGQLGFFDLSRRYDEPRLQHATLHHSGKDGGGGQVNRRATLHWRE
jgi:hypothetical protein